jgi:hypothetical protein
VEDEDGQPEMWVMGGADPDLNFLATVEAYNPRTNTWRSCLPLSQPRGGAVTGVVGGRLVVAGGSGGVGVFTSVEAYTPTGWIPLPPLPHAAQSATACVFNGRLCVIGSIFSGDKLQVLEMSEEGGFRWTVKAELPAARWAAGSCVREGKLWVVGGRVALPTGAYGSTATVLTYDFQNDTWATGPALPYALSHCYATTHDGEMCVTGLDDRVVGMSTETTFCCRDDAWVELVRPEENLRREMGTSQSLLLG